MTSEASASEHNSTDQKPDMRRLFIIGSAIALPLVLFAMTASLVMIFTLRSNVSALEDKARQATKAARALQKELADIRDSIPAAAPEPEAKKPQTVAYPPATAAVFHGEAAPLRVKALAPIPVCVFRAGDNDGLANCIKSRTRS